MANRPSIHEAVVSRKVPRPVGPGPHAIRVEVPGESLFVSGMLPQDAMGKMVTAEIKKQAELALGHVRNVVVDAKFSMDDLVRCTIYLTDINDAEAVDQVYQKMFVGQMLPARTVIQVAALPKGAHIQVDAIAVKRGKSVEEALAEEE